MSASSRDVAHRTIADPETHWLQRSDAERRMHRQRLDRHASASGQPRPMWGHLRLLEPIGTGAFGDVYRAFDTRLHREVALKLVRVGDCQQQRNASALSEGRHLAKVQHPNVVTVLGVDTCDGRVGFWMELIRGYTLAQLLRDLGPLGAREAVLIALDLCRALAAVHAAGLVHGDIKAQNVMREQGGRVVLMDFGACHGPNVKSDGLRRMTGTLVYLAPELLNGQVPAISGDIYSLGVLLFHLVTRDYPVRRHSVEEFKRAFSEGRARRLHDVRPDLPDAFVKAVDCALSYDPGQRYGTAGDMHSALARVLEPWIAPEASSSGQL
jgi:serine/threonine protein kinase